jgi:hypothetical protein
MFEVLYNLVPIIPLTLMDKLPPCPWYPLAWSENSMIIIPGDMSANFRAARSVHSHIPINVDRRFNGLHYLPEALNDTVSCPSNMGVFHVLESQVSKPLLIQPGPSILMTRDQLVQAVPLQAIPRPGYCHCPEVHPGLARPLMGVRPALELIDSLRALPLFGEAAQLPVADPPPMEDDEAAAEDYGDGNDQ